MDNKIAKILNRLNSKNREIREVREEYKSCIKARKNPDTNCIEVRAYSKEANILVSTSGRFLLTGEIVDSILALIEQYYYTEGMTIRRELNTLLKELKEVDVDEDLHTKS